MTNPRPEFEPEEPDVPEPEFRAGSQPGSLLLAWLRLMRLPNVFTALADVTMGFALVRNSLEPLAAFVCLAAGSALLYTAGMVLNDVFDIEIDRVERPQRPLPAGRIALPLARAIGFGMLALGVLLGWLAGLAMPTGTAIPWRSGIMATLLAGLVIAYDVWLKHTPLGPLGMGACRLANVLLGMSLATHTTAGWPLGYGPAELLAAAGIGLYIVGVTWFAKNEAEDSSAGPLLAAMAVMLAGVGLLALTPLYLPKLAVAHQNFVILLGLLMVPVLRRCFLAVSDPSPQRVQLAVKNSILSLIWLDAAMCAAVAGLPLALGVAALLIPAYWLGSWVYST